MNCIQANSLTKTFFRGRNTFNAVDNLDILITAGEFLQIVGRSGSGKTTLLYLLLGLLTPDNGTISILGNSLSDISNLDAFRNTHIGYIPQGNSLIMNLTVRDNIRLPYYLQKTNNSSQQHTSFIEQRTDELLDLLHMQDLAHMLPHSLSGGEIRRIMVARATLNNPELIIADEPTSNLDTENTTKVMNMLKTLHEQGTTIVMVTHETDILSYGTRTIEMQDGVFKTS